MLSQFVKILIIIIKQFFLMENIAESRNSNVFTVFKEIYTQIAIIMLNTSIVNTGKYKTHKAH